MSRRRSPAVLVPSAFSWCCWPPCRLSFSIRCRSSAPDRPITPNSPRRQAQALQRGPDRRRQGRQGHVRRTRRGGPCGRRFKVSDAWVGNETSASIQIKTILGQKYLALDPPRGSDTLNPSDVIPLDRTTSPYDVIEAFSAAAQTVGDIDSDQLAQSMVTLSQAFEGTPTEIRASLDGVSSCRRPSPAAIRNCRSCSTRPARPPRSSPTAMPNSTG